VNAQIRSRRVEEPTLHSGKFKKSDLAPERAPARDIMRGAENKGEATMADLLPRLETLKGRKRVLWRRETARGGSFGFLVDAQVTKEEGRILLRFSNGIANTGRGPMEVGGDTNRETRRGGKRSMPAYQRVYQTEGPPREVFVGRMVFDPDPDHRHWHYAGFAEYNLYDASGTRRRRSRKQAFCLEDFDRMKKRARAEYPRCRPTKMGVSPGWADTYTWDLHGQQVDITTLPSGTYRLESVANPTRRLVEQSHAGNRATVRLQIDKAAGRVTIL